MGLQQSPLEQMQSATEMTKTCRSWITTNIYHTKIPTVKRRKDPTMWALALSKWREISSNTTNHQSTRSSLH